MDSCRVCVHRRKEARDAGWQTTSASQTCLFLLMFPIPYPFFALISGIRLKDLPTLCPFTPPALVSLRLAELDSLLPVREVDIPRTPALSRDCARYMALDKGTFLWLFRYGVRECINAGSRERRLWYRSWREGIKRHKK